MAFSKLTWHKRTHGHEFTGAEFRVLMSIFDHSDELGRKSHPGLKLLMEETGYGRSAISEALTALQQRGWITQTRKGSGASRRTSVYELIQDAPNPMGWSGGADQLDEGSSTAGADQLPEVGPVERTSWSAGADLVGPLERTPTDPDNRSGSDPSRSDQGEVRYPPNHLGDQGETAPFGRSLAVAAKNDDPWAEPFEVRNTTTPEPATGGPHQWSVNPFADEGERTDAREGRAVDWSQYEPVGEPDMSPKAQRIRARRPFWADQ